MSKKAVWCFTIPSGLHDATTPSGKTVPWASKEYTVFIGPMELANDKCYYLHQNGYILCPRATTITKGQAIGILRSICAYQDGVQVKELETTRSNYHNACFKITPVKRPMDTADKEVADKRPRMEPQEEVVHNNQVVPVENVPEEITIEDEEEVIEDDESIIESDKPIIEDDKSKKVKDYMKNYTRVLVKFRSVVKNAIAKHGIVTTHPAFEDADQEDQSNAILCIALLPQLVDRARITDGIPGLWFHGRPHCGKSYLFSRVQNYKKIKSNGMCTRFKLKDEQAAFLIRGGRPGWLFKPANHRYIKDLVIGHRAYLCHDDVKGFIVVASRALPDYLSPLGPTDEGIDRLGAKKDHKIYRQMWKRRFLSLYFDDYVEFDPICVDYNVEELDIVARGAFQHAYSKLKSPLLQKLFKQYYDHNCAQWTDKDVELYENVFGKINSIN